jgi:hypothetical protein
MLKNLLKNAIIPISTILIAGQGCDTLEGRISKHADSGYYSFSTDLLRERTRITKEYFFDPLVLDSLNVAAYPLELEGSVESKSKPITCRSFWKSKEDGVLHLTECTDIKDTYVEGDRMMFIQPVENTYSLKVLLYLDELGKDAIGEVYYVPKRGERIVTVAFEPLISGNYRIECNRRIKHGHQNVLSRSNIKVIKLVKNEK